MTERCATPSIVFRTRDLIEQTPGRFANCQVLCARVRGALAVSETNVRQGVVERHQFVELWPCDEDGGASKAAAAVPTDVDTYLLDVRLAAYDTRAMPFDMQVGIEGAGEKVCDYIMQGNTHQLVYSPPLLTPRKGASNGGSATEVSPLEALGFSTPELYSSVAEHIDSRIDQTRAAALERLFGATSDTPHQTQLVPRFYLVPCAYRFATLLQRVYHLLLCKRTGLVDECSSNSCAALPRTSEALVFRAADLTATVAYIERELIVAMPAFELSKLMARIGPFGDVEWHTAWCRYVVRVSPTPSPPPTDDQSSLSSSELQPREPLVLCCAVTFHVYYVAVPRVPSQTGAPLRAQPRPEQYAYSDDDDYTEDDNDGETTLSDSSPLSRPTRPAPAPQRNIVAPPAPQPLQLTATSSSDEASGGSVESVSTVFTAMPRQSGASTTTTATSATPPSQSFHMPFPLNIMTPRTSSDSKTSPQTVVWDDLFPKQARRRRQRSASSKSDSALASLTEGFNQPLAVCGPLRTFDSGSAGGGSEDGLMFELEVSGAV
jgi:hypothetical protein